MAAREARPPLDLDTIRRLMEARVSIFVPTRQGLLALSLEELATWYADPLAYDAKLEGVSVEELLAYEQVHGNLPCPALTSRGQPCRGYVGHAGTPAEWLRRRGERCYQHQERDTARSRR